MRDRFAETVNVLGTAMASGWPGPDNAGDGGGELPFLAKWGGAEGAYSCFDLTGENLETTRVWRSSDGKERDFRFSEIADGTMLAWVGSGTGRVSKFYDQSRRRGDLAQVHSSHMPIIVENGKTVGGNTSPRVRFTGQSFMARSIVYEGFPQPFDSVFGFQLSDAVDGECIFRGSDNGGKDFTVQITDGKYEVFCGKSWETFPASTDWSLAYLHLNGSNSSLMDHRDLTKSVYGDPGFGRIRGLYLGANTDASESKNMKGTFSVLILFRELHVFSKIDVLKDLYAIVKPS